MISLSPEINNSKNFPMARTWTFRNPMARFLDYIDEKEKNISSGKRLLILIALLIFAWGVVFLADRLLNDRWSGGPAFAVAIFFSFLSLISETGSVTAIGRDTARYRVCGTLLIVMSLALLVLHFSQPSPMDGMLKTVLVSVISLIGVIGLYFGLIAFLNVFDTVDQEALAAGTKVSTKEKWRSAAQPFAGSMGTIGGLATGFAFALLPNTPAG